MRLSLAILFLSIPGLSQPVTVGVKGAARLTGNLEGDAESESKFYLVGPAVEVSLPYHFAFEAGALYSRFGYSSTLYGLLGDQYTERVRANAWEFPLLAKYRFTGGRAQPFIALGYAPRVAHARFDVSGFNVSFNTSLRSPFSYSSTASFDTGHALVVGAGLVFQKGHLRIAPEIRYLRWKDPLYDYYGSRGYYLFVPQNEVQLLLGIGWGR